MTGGHDLDYNDKPVCPHCGYAEMDAWEINFRHSESTTTYCSSCGDPYVVTQHTEITYSTALVKQ